MHQQVNNNNNLIKSLTIVELWVFEFIKIVNERGSFLQQSLFASRCCEAGNLTIDDIKHGFKYFGEKTVLMTAVRIIIQNKMFNKYLPLFVCF